MCGFKEVKKKGMESFPRLSLEAGGGNRMGKERGHQWEWKKEDEIPPRSE